MRSVLYVFLVGTFLGVSFNCSKPTSSEEETDIESILSSFIYFKEGDSVLMNRYYSHSTNGEPITQSKSSDKETWKIDSLLYSEIDSSLTYYVSSKGKGNYHFHSDNQYTNEIIDFDTSYVYDYQFIMKLDFSTRELNFDLPDEVLDSENSLEYPRYPSIPALDFTVNVDFENVKYIEKNYIGYGGVYYYIDIGPNPQYFKLSIWDGRDSHGYSSGVTWLTPYAEWIDKKNSGS